jgi:hypothetical protein
MNRVPAIVALACLAFVACDKNEPKPEGDTTAKSAATSAAPAAPQIADTDLATSADFEDEAEKTISAKTYTADLADLEKEIAKD